METKGLFRRAASKAKVDALKELVEENPGEGGDGEGEVRRRVVWETSDQGLELGEDGWDGRITGVNIFIVSDYSNFAGFSPYDVADMIKLYFRELPEPILTSKLSEMLIVLQESE